MANKTRTNIISQVHEYVPNSSVTSHNTLVDNLIDLAAELIVTETIPTGGTFRFSWATALDTDKTNGDISSEVNTNTWKASFRQPLLKGGGIDVNTASVRIARHEELSNVMALKSTLINTITTVITGYRNFLRAKGQVKVSAASMDRTEKLLERSRLLIEAGRMAPLEIVQVEADVANKEFDHQVTLNTLDKARLNLLKILDIDKYTLVDPVREGEINPIHLDLEKSIEIALSNRPDYNQAKLALETSKINFMLAENNMLWDLSLDSSYQYTDTNDQLNNTGTTGESWSVGLNLKIPIYGDLTRKQRLVSAGINVKKAKLNLEELKDNIEIEIQDLIQEVDSRSKQLNLARLARKLSQQKLEIEQEKLNTGLSSNFQIVTFQNDLLRAQNSEIDAVIAFRNALTEVDQALGTTLDTWKIEFKKR